MKTSSRCQGRAAAVGSVKGPSPERPAMTRMRRKPTFPPSPWNGEVRPKVDPQNRYGRAAPFCQVGWANGEHGGCVLTRLTCRQAQARKVEFAALWVAEAIGT